MNTQQSGSALLLVIFVTAVLVIATTTTWYAASLLHDASLLRQKTAQRKHAVEGLLTYACAVAAGSFDVVRDDNVMYTGEWPCGDGTTYQGVATSKKAAGDVTVVAALKDGAAVVASRTACLQQREDDKSIYVTAWGVHEATS